MTKIDHDAALELAEAYISWWNRSAAPIKSEYATLLARAYIDLRAERELLLAVAEAADNFLTENKAQCGGRIEVGEYDTLMDKVTAWRER